MNTAAFQHAATRSIAPPRTHAALASAAVALPMLVAVNLPPHVTLLNGLAALLGWGCWLSWLVASNDLRVGARTSGLNALHGALAVLAASALAAPLWAGLPWSLALGSVAVLAAAALVAQVGASLQGAGRGAVVFEALCIGLVVAALLNGTVGIVQVFAPAWADGHWIATSHIEGRAVGNMHQPNHLASLMVWAVVASVWLGEVEVLRRRAVEGVVALFVFVVVLSVSRTGAVSLLLLTAWGALDRRLSRPARWLLLALPLLYLLFWWGTSVWSGYFGHSFGGRSRFESGDSMVASGRYLAWANTLELISRHPWSGIGWGEFGFAWTLTAFPERPQEYFGHPHNLLLAFAVEIGLPLTLLVLALQGRALWAAFAPARVAAMHPAAARRSRAGMVMVGTILFHSLLEYPLWHLYFLLPTVFVLGLCLGREGAEPAAPAALPVAPAGTRPLLVATLALALAGPVALLDYAAVLPPPSPDAHVEHAEGRPSLLFSHLAEREAALRLAPVAPELRRFGQAPHEFIDAPVLRAWAIALDAAGQTERARYIAQRLREFRSESQHFFAPCAEPPSASAPLPFQCKPPQRTFVFEDFR